MRILWATVLIACFLSIATNARLLQAKHLIEKSRIASKRSFWILPEAFQVQEQTQITTDFQYCSFILEFKNQLEPEIYQPCEKWLKKYMNYLARKEEELKQKQRLALVKHQQLLNAPVENRAKEYILRQS